MDVLQLLSFIETFLSWKIVEDVIAHFPPFSEYFSCLWEDFSLRAPLFRNFLPLLIRKCHGFFVSLCCGMWLFSEEIISDFCILFEIIWKLCTVCDLTVYFLCVHYPQCIRD